MRPSFLLDSSDGVALLKSQATMETTDANGKLPSNDDQATESTALLDKTPDIVVTTKTLDYSKSTTSSESSLSSSSLSSESSSQSVIEYGTQHGRPEEEDVEEAAPPNETPANRKGVLRTIMVLTIGITLTSDLSLDVID